MESGNIKYEQPYTIDMEVSYKTNAKGESHPEISVRIERHLGETDIINIMERDLTLMVEKAKSALKSLQELDKR